MSIAIPIVWAIFLALALAITLADVYLLARVVFFSRAIHRVSKVIVPAAGGIAAHTAVSEPLIETVRLGGALANRTGSVADLTTILAPKLSREAL